MALNFAADRGSTIPVALMVGATAIGVIASLLVLTNQTMRATEQRLQDAAGLDAAHTALADIEAALDEDPGIYLTEVLNQERPRLCPGSPEDTRGPGAVWSVAECGTTWAYAPGGGTVTEQGDARVEIVPPTSSDPNLTVRAVAVARDGAVGVERTYTQQTAAAFTAISDVPVSVDDLYPGSTATVTDAVLYSAELLTGATTSSVTFGRSVFAAHGAGVTNAPGGTNLTFEPGGARDINDFVAGVVRTGALRASVTDTVQIGCPASNPVSLRAGGASTVCLDPGRELLDVDGGIVTVPDDVTMFLIRPDGTANGVPVLDIRYRTDPPQVPRCLTSCDVTAGVDPAAHPGVLTAWQTFDGQTRFYAPASGVVATTRDTQVGLCGPAFISGGTCTPATFDPGHNLTVVAGTSQRPADIYIGGPIDAAQPIGIVAHNDVIVGTWARPPGGTLEVDAAAVALDLGTTSSTLFGADDGLTETAGGTIDRRDQTWPGGIRTAPAVVNPSTANSAALLRWTGSVASTDLDLRFSAFDAVEIVPATTAPAPPYFPAIQPRWDSVAERPLSGVDLCGEPTCDDL